MINVYHHPLYDDVFICGSARFNPRVEDAKLVAIINTDDLETAYELTQNFSAPWGESDDMRFVSVCPCQRSTSKGDIMVIDTGENTRKYIVGSAGFLAEEELRGRLHPDAGLRISDYEVRRRIAECQ